MNFNFSKPKISWRRLISLILVVLLCVSTVDTAVFAEESEGTESNGSSNVYDGDVTGNATAILDIAKELSLGEPVSTDITDGSKSAYFKFTPNATKTYKITTETETDFRLWCYDMSTYEEPDCYVECMNGMGDTVLKKNKTYLFRVQFDDETVTGNVMIQLDEVDVEFGSGNVYYGGDVTGNAEEIQNVAKNIGLNTNEKAKINSDNLAAYYLYIPEKTGVYCISASSADKTSSVEIDIYDYSDIEIPNPVKYGENEIPTVILKQGVSYLIRTRLAEKSTDDSEGMIVSGAVTVKVTEANGSKLSTGENAVKLKGEEKIMYSFVPESSGMYYFYDKNNSSYIKGIIYDAEGNQIASGIVGGEDLPETPIWIVCNLEKDQTYYIELYCSNTAFCNLAIDKTGGSYIQDVSVGKTAINKVITEEETFYYRFTAMEEGTYHIFRTDRDRVSVYSLNSDGVLKRIKNNEITAVVGEVYFFTINGMDEVIDTNLVVEKTDEASGKEVREVYLSDMSIWGVNRFQSYMLGTGDLHSLINVSNDDETVATVDINYNSEFDETIMKVTGLKEGNTTIHVSISEDENFYDYSKVIKVYVHKKETEINTRNLQVGERFENEFEVGNYENVTSEIGDTSILKTDENNNIIAVKPGFTTVHLHGKGNDFTGGGELDILYYVNVSQVSLKDKCSWQKYNMMYNSETNIEVIDSYDGTISDLSVSSSDEEIVHADLVEGSNGYQVKLSSGTKNGIAKVTLNTKETTCFTESSVDYAVSVSEDGSEIECDHEDTVKSELGCNTGLTRYITCQTCGQLVGTEEIEDPDDEEGIIVPSHEFEDVLILKEATGCSWNENNEGSKISICSKCGLLVERWYFLDHDFEEHTVSPTCESYGYTTMICKNCGEQDWDNWDEWDYVPELGHDYDESTAEIIKEATCGSSGRKAVVCKRCGKKEILIIPATGEHEFEATTIDGTDTYICSKCGVRDDAPGEDSYLKDGILHVGDKEYFKPDIVIENSDKVNFSSDDVKEFTDFRGKWVEKGKDLTFTASEFEGYSINYIEVTNGMGEWSLELRSDETYKIAGENVEPGLCIYIGGELDESAQATVHINNLKAERTEEGILLTWDDVKDADEYTIGYSYYVDGMTVADKGGEAGTSKECRFLYTLDQMASDQFADDEYEQSYRFIVRTNDGKAEASTYIIACAGSNSEYRIAKVMGDFASFAGDNYITSSEKVPDEVVYNYTRSVYHLYEDSKKLTYNISYDEFMEKVDSLFVNHSDMKEYLTNKREYDEEKNLVKLNRIIDHYDSKECQYTGYKDNGSTYTVYGRWLHYMEEEDITEDMVKGEDYIVNSYIDDNNEEQNIYYRIGDNVIVTFTRSEEGALRVASYEKTAEQDDCYIKDEVLHKDGKTYVKLNIKYNESDSAEVKNENILSFDGLNGLWIERGKDFKFTIDVKSGYELANVQLGNSVVLEKNDDGSYSVDKDMTNSTVTITVNVNVLCSHTWDSGKVTKEATCTDKGKKTFTCTKCNETKIEEIAIDSNNHTPDEAVEENRVEATCAKEGSYDVVVYCVACHKELSRESKTIEKKEHSWNAGEVTKKATCTDKGEKTFTCTECNETRIEEIAIDSNNHTPDEAVEENRVEATCAKEGSYDVVVYCAACHKELSRESKTIEKKEHSWNNGIVTVSATCTEDGEKTYTCTECNETKTEVLPALDHQEEILEARKATCTLCGLSEGSHCLRCGKITKAQEITDPATGHTWDEGKVTEAPTTETTGVKTFTCDTCGETKTTVIPKLESEYSSAVEVVNNKETVDATKINQAVQNITSATSDLETDKEKAEEVKSNIDMDTLAELDELYIKKNDNISETVVESEIENVKVEGAALAASSAVEGKEDSDTNYQAKLSINEVTDTSEAVGNTYVLDINLALVNTSTYKEEEIQPVTPIRITIPIPEQFATTDFIVKHKLADGTYEDVDYERTADSIIIIATGFSNYIVKCPHSHEVKIGKDKSATCMEEGSKSGRKCKDCGFVIEEIKTIPREEHKLVASWDWSDDYKSAKATIVCSECKSKYAGDAKVTSKQTKAPTVSAVGKKEYTAVVDIQIEGKTYSYSDKQIVDIPKLTPVTTAITASDIVKTVSTKAQSFNLGVKTNSDGKISFSSNNKKYIAVNSSGKITVAKNYVGKANITINVAASGVYTAASKVITVTVNPAKVKLSTVKNIKGKKISVKWKRNSKVTGYQLQYSTDKNFKSSVKTVSIGKNKSVTKTVKSLKKGKTYYVRVRTYKKVSGGKFYSGWSSVKAVKIKK